MRGMQDVVTEFLGRRADGIGDARRQATDAAMTDRDYYAGRSDTEFDQGFKVNELQERIRQAMAGEDIDWTKMGTDLLGSGVENAGSGSAGATDSANAGTAGTAAMMKWLAEFFKNQKPAVTPPAGEQVNSSGVRA
jgi:hypothetical protein